MASLQDTPSANRLHIGVFGKTNSGKSTFVNTFTGQQVSIVSDVPGTTTDPVTKAMEIYPLGACVLLDTAGFDDETELGKARIEKTRKAAEKTEVAIFVVSQKGMEAGEDLEEEKKWISFFREKDPFLEVDSTNITSLLGIFLINQAIYELSKLDTLSDLLYRDMTYISDKIKEEMIPILELLIDIENGNDIYVFNTSVDNLTTFLLGS